MTDTIEEIRARHEAVELALQTTGLRSQEAHAAQTLKERNDV